jgi:DNA-3-methyladenine glycosylase I
MTGSRARQDCGWNGDAAMTAYHDYEWGTPVHDDRRLFEALVLDGMQAGLSWKTILDKRENFRAAFDNFDPEKIARYTPARIEKLLANPGIIRNRRKIEAAIANAKACLAVRKEFGSFDAYLWNFVGGKQIDNGLTSLKQMPAESEESRRMSADLKKRGFRFVGPTICYAFMQAVGMVNDHLVTCFRHRQVQGHNRKWARKAGG